MSKFRVGDRITVVKGHGISRSGVVKEIEGMTENTPVHHVLIDGMNQTAVYYEDAMIFGDSGGRDIMNQEIYESKDNTFTERRPKFRVGDVVESTDGLSQAASSYPVYVIKETTELLNEGIPIGYSYKSAPIDSPDDNIILSEEVLLFQYHDTNWQEYFTESVRNNLPAWRGELYNFYMFSDNSDDYRDYKNDTLPPMRMKHILEGHSIYERIEDTIGGKGNIERNKQNRKIIIEKLGLEDNMGLDFMSKTVKRKIVARNTTDMSISDKEKASKKDIPKFTEQELQFVALIDELDISNGAIKDHYPVEMTNLQIMDAIREAYCNDAKKIGERKFNSSNGTKSLDDEDLDAPDKGKLWYEGYSPTYDLVIHFMYNFDYDFIETAYPPRMNNNVKKQQN